MIRCGVYTRQSEDADDDELAVDRQWDEIIEEICTPRGWEPVRYCDNDKTAVGAKRKLPERDRMLKDIQEGNLQAMAAWDCDRLYREPRDLEDIIDIADTHGILLATVTGDVDLGTDNGRLFARVKGAFAKGETERRSARQKAKGRQLAAAGESWGSRRPFGYTRGGAIMLREAGALAEIYDLILSGHRNIAGHLRMLNGRGIRTSLGNTWTKQQQLTAILKNPRYKGIRTYKGEEIREGNWERIVEPDVWQAVYDILADPERRSGLSTGRKYLQVGLSRCGRCAVSEVVSTMDTTPSGHSPAAVYRCRTCFGVSRRVKLADDHIESLVVARLARPDAEELLVDQKRPDLDKLRAEVAAAKERLTSLAVDFAEGELDKDQLKIATARLKSKIKTAKSIMEDANKAQLFRGVTGENAKLFLDLGLDRKRALIDALMTITFNPARRRGQWNPDDIVIDWKM